MEPTKVTIDLTDTGLDVSCHTTVDGLDYSYTAHLDAHSVITSEELTERHPLHDQRWQVAMRAGIATHLTLYDTSDPDEPTRGMWHEDTTGRYVIADQDDADQPHQVSVDAFGQRFAHVKLLNSHHRHNVANPLRQLALRYSRNLAHARTGEQDTTRTLPEIKIYTKPDCVQCQATKRRLDAAGVPYTLTDISNDPQMIEQMRAAGFTSMPIVEYGQERFAGYQVDRIKALTQAFGAVNTTPTTAADTAKPTTPGHHKTPSRSR